MVVLLKGNGINKNFSLDSALGAESVYDFRERERQGFIYLFIFSIPSHPWEGCGLAAVF